MNKTRAVADLLRLDRPYGTFLLMAPALWALFIASQGRPTLHHLLVFLTGPFLMRSAGCVLNDLADRNIDIFVARTRNRPLPSGRLTVREALVMAAILLSAALALVLTLNRLTQALAVGGAALAACYPYAKRRFPAPQLVMGVTFGWGGLMAWTAVRGAIETPAILIFLATVCWATAYDTVYALQDAPDDRKIGIRSTALLFGRHTWIAVGVLNLAAVAGLVLLGRITGLGRWYLFAILLIFVLFGYQTAIIREHRDPVTTFSVFKSNVGVGLLVFLGILLDFRLPAGQ